MAQPVAQTSRTTASSVARVAVVLAATVFLGACAGSSDLLPDTTTLASNDAQQAASALDPQAELRKATEYWGQQHAKKPTDKTAGLNYAKNLKANGDKRQALVVLQNVFALHQSDPEVAGELGRLALEFDQLSFANRALSVADVPENPDWRVISARGTVLAKQGQHKAAIAFFERALSVSPNQPSVLNNLAMANAMSGNPQRAEQILRDLAQLNGAPAKVNQNLALVLGLQGKYDESKAAAAAVVPGDVAAANTEYLRQMVRLEPQHSPVPAAANAVAQAPLPALKPASIDTASGDAWQAAVTASAATPGLRDSNR